MNREQEQRLEDLARVLDDAAVLLSQALERATLARASMGDTALITWCESARKTLAEANTLI